MTATDELRKLLDERGVEWRDDSSIYGTRRTVWKVDGVTFVAAEVSGRLKVSGYLTPDQAIEATLGRRTCRNECEATEVFFYCSECGCAHLRNPAYVDMPRYCPNCGRKVRA
jgi:hypothetical protein